MEGSPTTARHRAHVNSPPTINNPLARAGGSLREAPLPSSASEDPKSAAACKLAPYRHLPIHSLIWLSVHRGPASYWNTIPLYASVCLAIKQTADCSRTDSDAGIRWRSQQPKHSTRGLARIFRFLYSRPPPVTNLCAPWRAKRRPFVTLIAFFRRRQGPVLIPLISHCPSIFSIITQRIFGLSCQP